ncbi:WPP domain-interacting tail-anchored protein 1-like isoform X2 [Magnolia sinica]|uniref:WPP domain-interacting tail-anchored protein 1-like isoform X2 n=1 Tax=Magnolia sinica TaxID=86752 RepID=UPI002658F7AF|nr:WPP domain-interacting tail-anchored protein 1-like isoform X2 [Magnolia sinica]
MSVDDSNAKDPQAGSDDSPAGERTRELGNAGEVLTRLDIGLAYSFEKLLNLDILLMHVADRASHYEALVVENEDASSDSFEKALEFDILSGMLDSEVKELDNFVVSLQERIFDAREKISSCEHSNGTFTESKQKLHDCEESLKQCQDQVAEMRMQSAVFESTIAFGGQEYWNNEVSKSPENSQLPSLNAKMKLQTAEQQRHILGMLEKSLARELDLEKRLSESKDNEEELKLKLHHAEGVTLSIIETTDLIAEKLFEAENVTVVLMGISKELMGKLQIVQFNLNSSIQREGEARLKLRNSMQFETLSAEIDNLKSKLKQAEDKCSIADTEVVTLRENVKSLEGQLRESDSQLELVKASVEASQGQQHLLSSEINDLEIVIEDLRESVSRAESQAESLECKCKLLAETNLELNEELGLLRNNNGIDKVNFLEKQLRQSETQLQHAKATIEASKEQQTMLNSTLHDMENLIEDLKAKASKAEGRAESAESKCVLLTETNLELNEELSFLRSRIECLETSLHQADNAKIATAKDIAIRTKVITNLVMQLAMERERLQTQIFTNVCHEAR